MVWIPCVEARTGQVVTDRLAVPGNSGEMTLPDPSAAADVLGIPRTTLRDWLNKGESS